MENKTYLKNAARFIAVVCIALIYSCSQSENKPVETKSVSRTIAAVPAACTVKAFKDTSYKIAYTAYRDTSYKIQFDSVIACVPKISRGVYQSGLKSIVGNLTKENQVIAGCKKYKIDFIYFYDGDGVNDLACTKFFSRLKREAGLTDIGATAGSLSGLQKRVTWNNAHADSSDYNTVNYEYEPWRADTVTGGLQAAWTNNITMLREGKKAIGTKPTKLVDYYGWWTKEPMLSQTPDTLAKYCSYILLHNYRVKPDFAYMRTRCNNMNVAFKKINQIGEIVPIGSGELEFLFPWLKAGHTLDEWFNLMKKDFDAMGYTNIKMNKYVFFTLDHLNDASIPANARAVFNPIDPNYKRNALPSHIEMSKYVEADSTDYKHLQPLD